MSGVYNIGHCMMRWSLRGSGWGGGGSDIH